MSEASDKRSDEFLKISSQFKLGALVTESSHPATATLSEVAKRDIVKALDSLFQVDSDVVATFRKFVASNRAGEIKDSILTALRKGGRIFFTGCGSTGRLSILLVSIWRDFWQRQRAGTSGGTIEQTRVPLTRERGKGASLRELAEDLENRVFSVMAGGDFALIKSVEGFEDITAFGQKQLGDYAVAGADVVFAITEGGETPFVIGTAWKGVEAGAKVYFVYNNPDAVLCRHVQRSREIIEDSRIDKINLTTGPMAITGSTRMQATTIQLCVLVTLLEMAARDLLKELDPAGRKALDPAKAPETFCAGLERLLLALRAPDFLSQLASLVALEERVYRSGRRNNYYADRFALDVLTDTTERSPTYCTPPFRKQGDAAAADSWAFLFTPEAETPRAWERLLKRPPRCIDWSGDEVRTLVGEGNLERTGDILQRIRGEELMRFRIGHDGLDQRPLGAGDSAIAILAGAEARLLVEADGFANQQFAAAHAAGSGRGVLWVGGPFSFGREFAAHNPDCISVFLAVPPGRSLLGGLRHVGLKLVLNALSTCTMVRLGRVMGNTMIWVVPSNLKLIDRATRYIQKLAGLAYEPANRLLFDVLEYLEPRMKADRSYPPAVGLAVMRARHQLTNEEAEKRLASEL
jgi:N-acetylmuramic acid 6-phosphate etherase